MKERLVGAVQVPDGARLPSKEAKAGTPSSGRACPLWPISKWRELEHLVLCGKA